jgi:GNAT superfamily N-acetyltransferase
VGGSDREHTLDVASPRDVKPLLRLIEEAGWAYTRAEVERLIAVQPGGMILLRSSGIRHGILGCVYASAWGRTGFIGLMLVRGSHRKRGLGRQLMTAALEYLETKGTEHVLLDAVVDAIGFYSNLGFRSSWQSLRYGVDTSRAELPESDLDTMRAGAREVEEAIGLDRAHAGMDRSVLLRRLMTDGDSRFLAVRADDRLLAYGVLRRSKGCMRLGPLVASPRVEDAVAVRSIVASAMTESYPRMLTMNVPAYNREAKELMIGLGATEYAPCTRMSMGDPGPAAAPEGVWALGAAEKG